MNWKEITLEESEFPLYLLDECCSALMHTILFIRSPGQVTSLDHACQRLAPLVFAKCDMEERPIRQNIELLVKNREKIGPKLHRGVISITFFEKRQVKQSSGFLGTIFSSAPKEEKFLFERWQIPIIINENYEDLLAMGAGTNQIRYPSPGQRTTSTERTRTNSGENERRLSFGAGGGGGDNGVDPTAAAAAAAATQTERVLIIEASRKQVQNRIRQIIENANQYTDHIPQKDMYDFDINVSASRDQQGSREGGQSGGSVVSKLLNAKGLLDNLS